MNETYIKKSVSILMLLILLILSFFLLKPILLSIIFGAILAFIFYPIYNQIRRKIKTRNFSAILMCLILLLIIILPLWFLTPILIDQSIKIFVSAQQIDFTTPLKSFFPEIFIYEDFSTEIGSVLNSFATKTAATFMTSIADFLLNLPVLLLQLLVVFFTFFFVLRDKDKLVEYIDSVMPFTKDVKKKLLDSSRAITTSVLYGQVVIGIIQGIILGIGLFIFGVSNALLLSIFAIFAGIFPIIGTFIVWVPILVYLLVAGNTVQAIGILLFGMFSSSIDNLLRPLIVSKMTKLNSSIVLIGMIGGLFMFGILGLILGPLILAYTLILLEFYRKSSGPKFLVANTKK